MIAYMHLFVMNMYVWHIIIVAKAGLNYRIRQFMDLLPLCSFPEMFKSARNIIILPYLQVLTVQCAGVKWY